MGVGLCLFARLFMLSIFDLKLGIKMGLETTCIGISCTTETSPCAHVTGCLSVSEANL